jgi:hypothetical protein
MLKWKAGCQNFSPHLPLGTCVLNLELLRLGGHRESLSLFTRAGQETGTEPVVQEIVDNTFFHVDAAGQDQLKSRLLLGLA